MGEAEAATEVQPEGGGDGGPVWPGAARGAVVWARGHREELGGPVAGERESTRRGGREREGEDLVGDSCQRLEKNHVFIDTKTPV